MNFSDLNLIAPILQAAEAAGYKSPSPIQQKAIPIVLANTDLLGCAQTGTGKTAAFAMPILQQLFKRKRSEKKRMIRALILTPTRELALQIDENFTAYGKHLPLKNFVIFGGVNQNPQVTALKAGVDILTATPGRLNDLIGQGHIDLSKLEIFVLDEADRMLDMGFVNDVRKVLRQIPKQRQTLLFSATMPKEIETLAQDILHNPVTVMVTPPSTTVERIEQSVYFAEKAEKRQLLATLLKNKDIASALVFTRTKHGADRVVKDLTRIGVQAMAIHGNKSQNARQMALGRFKEGSLRVLVATDIAARGIDVSGLTHVFNYDLPNMPETYVHRIGRTGRAGKPGIAIGFCSEEERPYLADIEKEIHMKIPVMDLAGSPAKQERKGLVMDEKKAMPAIQENTDAAKRRRRRGGRRHGKNKPEGASAAQQPQRTPQKSNSHPVQKATAKPEKKPQPAKPVAQTDDSIQLISRRVPAQKYASFDDYMKEH